MKTIASLSLVVFIVACQPQTVENKPEKASEHEVVESLDQKKDQDAVFENAIKKLEEIHFFIAGKDSILTTKDPTTLTELNTVKSAFYSPFDDSEEGLEKFKDIVLAHKFHVQKKGEAPSANIIELSFKNEEVASDWFDVFDNSLKKKIILNKPKTTLWLSSNKVYFIQTYKTQSRTFVDQLSFFIKNELELL